MDKDFDEINREVFPEEVEANNIEEIQENGKSVEGDINDVDDVLQPFVVDDFCGITIKKDGQDVDSEDDGKVEPHAVKIKRYRFFHVQLVEKLDVEQIKHPTADANRQKCCQ